MAVDDHGIEVLKKAGEEVTPGDKSNYYIKVNDIYREGIIANIPFDAVSVTYPNSTTEVYSFKTGGLSGSVVATVEVIFTDSSKVDLLSAERV
jgi:hypothetical protein